MKLDVDGATMAAFGAYCRSLLVDSRALFLKRDL